MAKRDAHAQVWVVSANALMHLAVSRLAMRCIRCHPIRGAAALLLRGSPPLVPWVMLHAACAPLRGGNYVRRS